MTLNSSCASQVQVDHLSSTNYRLSATLALIAVLLTFILSITAVTYMSKKSIFQSATRRILIFNILFANLHQVMYAIFSVSSLISKCIFIIKFTRFKSKRSENFEFDFKFLKNLRLDGERHDSVCSIIYG